MLKKINQALNLVIGCLIGVFLGYSIFRFYDFKMHPERYIIQSAPWYTSVFLYGAVTIVIVAVILLVKYIIRRKIQK